jgi:hypothetical protein
MVATLVASNAMIGLSKLRYTAIVSHEESTTCFAVILVLLAFGYVSFVDTLIIVYQNCRDIKAIRTRHTIFAIVAWDGGVLLDKFARLVEKLLLLFA